MKQRVSDVITEDEIGEWKLDDIVIIDANTGAGKSYFIKNVLYQHARKNNERILMLVHRDNCKYQFLDELESDNKTDIIDLMTYQSIDNKGLRKYKCDLSQYQYIVCDEFHYFMSDSSFNKITDISLDKILEASCSTKIFMSATGDTMKRYIKGYRKFEVKEYEIPKDYTIIKSLYYFNNDSAIESILEDIIEKTEDKAIVFINSVEKCYQLFKKFEHISIFNCSKSNAMYRYVDSEKVESILKNEKFKERILFTTICMDAGVNIRDRKLKHIICDVKDIGVMQQCVGRKRAIDEWDKMSLYIKNLNNNSIGGYITKYKKKVEMADYYRKHNLKEFIEKYPRELDYSQMIYDVANKDENVCSKEINKLMYFKYKTDIVLLQSIIRKGSDGYQKYIADLFEQKEYGIIDSNLNGNKDELINYLENSVGHVMLQVKDRQELIGRINVRSGGHLLKGKQIINDALEERNIPYRIIQFSINEMVNGKLKKYPSAWRIDKLTVQ